MLYRFTHYLKYILGSTNQHGIHSPFIYAYVTKCLYKKSRFKGNKNIKALFKGIAYFKAKTFFTPKNGNHIIDLVKESFPLIETDQRPADIIYLDEPNNVLFSSIIKEGIYHNDSMLWVNNIHYDKESTQTWETLKNHAKVTVSVDLFYCGALFFRKEQAKEHFKVRI
ncbi:MAG: hypothetical protein CR994_07065 [Maribacter sp.]|nr:MAG: hypothetical protein CR994_07065 [Maribacter sp.]